MPVNAMHVYRLSQNRLAHARAATIARDTFCPGILPWLLAALLVTLTLQASAQTITWSSLSNSVNSTHSDPSGMSGFRFELGVFANGFVPTRNNIDQWAVHWTPAQVTFYNSHTNRFAGKFTVSHNNAPFTSGTAAYIWGFHGSPHDAEWILFRKSTWAWPSASSTPSPVSNNSLSWVAEQADIVFLGDIQNSGHPYLMKAASVADARPPNTPWHVWLQQEIGGDVSNFTPHQDDDNDGVSNLLEFVMGSNPKKGGGIPGTPAEIVPENSNKYLQISIPRRIDRTAILTVQVSDHPAGPWHSGPEHTTEIHNSIDSLIVRDRTPIGPSAPRRFMRLHVELPPGQ